MGFLKKITRPISRVLDKVIPNEIKPALPFLAAAAPFLAPGLMGAFGNTMLSRGLISGGLNLGSQLAQEGSDGDFSALSLAMASGIGALSAPGSAGYGTSDVMVEGATPSAADFFKNKAAGMEPGFAKSGLGALEGTSNYLTGVSDTLQNNLFSKEGLKAAMLPVGQGITDLAVAENRRAMKDYERDMADAEAEQGASDAQRAAAIRQSMEAYGFTEEEIEDAIYAAGYRAGGRVGLKGGGMDAGQMYITEPGIMGNPAVMEKIENMREFMIANPDIEDITDYSEKYESKDPDFEGIEGAVKEVDKEIDYMDVPYSLFVKAERAVENEEINPRTGDPYTNPNQYIEAFLKGYKEEDFKYKKGGKVTSEGGLMNLGGKEMDLRKGGFVPIGKKEKPDDVPARLSKNEFVMTADAVRAAGGGSVNKGAKRMYNLMNNLEARV